MNKYNAYYFFKNIEKKLNDNFTDNSVIINEIYSFIQKDRSYDYLISFKNLEDLIYQSKNTSEINLNKITECINKLTVEIENEISNMYKDYSYIEEKLRSIIFAIK